MCKALYKNLTLLLLLPVFIKPYQCSLMSHTVINSVRNLVDIKFMLEILNLNNLIESYDTKLRNPSFWDTLYVISGTGLFTHRIILNQKLSYGHNEGQKEST